MKFLDVSKYGFVVEPRYYFFGWNNSSKIIGRESLVKALVKAKKLLPKGYNFKIWDLKRPRAVQLKMIKSFRKRLQIMYPNKSHLLFEKMVYNFAAKPLLKVVKPDTHRNGGAIDLTIIDTFGNELYMGTDHDDLTSKAATNYFTDKMNLTASQLEAKKNRALLCKVMSASGFENYAPEWWHWSHED